MLANTAWPGNIHHSILKAVTAAPMDSKHRTKATRPLTHQPDLPRSIPKGRPIADEVDLVASEETSLVQAGGDTEADSRIHSGQQVLGPEGARIPLL